MEEGPDAPKDIKRFLPALEGKPSKTISAYVAALKTFFTDNKVPFDGTQWKRLRRRGFMPKRGMPSPRVVSRYGRQDTQIQSYLEYRQKIKNMIANARDF